MKFKHEIITLIPERLARQYNVVLFEFVEDGVDCCG